MDGQYMRYILATDTDVGGGKERFKKLTLRFVLVGEFLFLVQLIRLSNMINASPVAKKQSLWLIDGFWLI